MHHSPPKLGEALGGETKISYRPSPFCLSSNGERNPKAKSEDDAVGAPRLVLRRLGQDLMRRSATPRRQSAKPQWDVGRPAGNFYIEVLVRVPGDESVRQ